MSICRYFFDFPNTIYTILCNKARNTKQIPKSQILVFMDMRVYNRSNKIPPLNDIPALIQFNAFSIITVN